MKGRLLALALTCAAIASPAMAWQGYKDYTDRDKNWAATVFDMPGFMPQRLGSGGFDSDFSVAGSVILNIGASFLDSQIPFSGTILSALVQSGMENFQQKQIVRQQPKHYAERRSHVRYAQHRRRKTAEDRDALRREIIAELEQRYVFTPRYERREQANPKVEAVPAPKAVPKAKGAPAPQVDASPQPKGKSRFEYDELPPLSQHPYIHDARFGSVGTMLEMHRALAVSGSPSPARGLVMFAAAGRKLLDSTVPVRREYEQPLQINTGHIHKALLITSR